MLACRFTEICQVMRGSVTIKLKAVTVVANGLLLSPRKKKQNENARRRKILLNLETSSLKILRQKFAVLSTLVRLEIKD